MRERERGDGAPLAALVTGTTATDAAGMDGAVTTSEDEAADEVREGDVVGAG